MPSELDLLAEVPLFSLLDEKARSVLMERVETVVFKSGETIFNVGDPGHAMYVVKKGTVSIFARTKTGEQLNLEEPGPGDFFGEVSLLDEGPRTAGARAQTDVELLEIERSDVYELIEATPKAAMSLLAATGRRLRQTTAALRNAATRNVNEQVLDERSWIMKAADWIAAFSGSLTFLFLHAGAFAIWIGYNAANKERAFDAFPFSFLTLVLSIESIFLSVFVLLSANRQTQREKVRNDVEYDVNLKAEMQIAHMHEKVDDLYAEIGKRLDRIEKRLAGGPTSTR